VWSKNFANLCWWWWWWVSAMPVLISDHMQSSVHIVYADVAVC